MFNYHVEDGKILEKENESLEFKSALKGIPSSTWETYSAFANSFGGTILLGVQDRTGTVEGVPHAELRVQELWNTLNNPQVVNVNLLRNEDITTFDCDGVQIIAITVPRADRYLRPVYYKRMETGTFKRNGEGDFRCNMPEIASLLRDQCSNSYDSTVLENTSFEDIDRDTLQAYRNEMRSVHPDHLWNTAEDKDFARKIGAMGHATSMLTVAGLLMFGKEEVITAYFPRFKLDYLECPVGNTTWNYRRVTGDGLWVGNIYNFFTNVRGRINADVENPPDVGLDMHRIAYTDTHKAIRECLINCLVHADYLGSLGVKIEIHPRSIALTNPGLFRIPVEIAEKGGESDPRNAVIARMFSLIGMSERAGIGINYLFETWRKQYGHAPDIKEDTRTQRTSVELELGTVVEYDETDRLILETLMNDPTASMGSISMRIGVSRPTVAIRIKSLKSRGILRRIGGTRGYWECEYRSV
ncbi:MAG: putative DNA binding domain-containing protein [archaeon]|nr:putative DNA binding domain-containing protein [archaeon]